MPGKLSPACGFPCPFTGPAHVGSLPSVSRDADGSLFFVASCAPPPQLDWCFPGGRAGDSASFPSLLPFLSLLGISELPDSAFFKNPRRSCISASISPPPIRFPLQTYQFRFLNPPPLLGPRTCIAVLRSRSQPYIINGSL